MEDKIQQIIEKWTDEALCDARRSDVRFAIENAIKEYSKLIYQPGDGEVAIWWNKNNIDSGGPASALLKYRRWIHDRINQTR